MMSTVSTRSPLAQEVSRLAANLQNAHDLQQTLSKLNQLDAPLSMLRGFQIQRLATRFIMDKDVKTDARSLVAKIRRMERGSTTVSMPSRDTISPATEEIMVTSKRTAPVMTAPKPKMVSAQQDVRRLPTIMEQSEKRSEQLSKLEDIKKRLAEKKETVKATKRRHVLIELQQSAKPEPPQKKRCYRRF